MSIFKVTHEDIEDDELDDCEYVRYSSSFALLVARGDTNACPPVA